MFESKTYENILASALARVPDTMDKRQSAIIYDAIAPACAELAQAYIDLDLILKETFADTAEGDYLEKRTRERGINREPATHAVVKLVTTPVDIQVPLNSIFSCQELNFTVTEKLADGIYKCICDTAGSEANSCSGQAIPNEYIRGLATANITEILKPAEDAEDDETLRARYLASLRDQAFGGNIADYKEKIHKLEGVGGVKVTPVWNGGGTVLITISASDYTVPTEYLINEVQTAIDPTGDQKGVGIAPIGHIVTVKGAVADKINITTKLTFADGYQYENVSTLIEKALDEYYAEERKEWEKYDETGIIIRISQIETRLLAINGIMDIADTTINGIAKNYQLSHDALPVRGTFAWSAS